MAAPSLPMDDRDGVIWYNGKLVPWREAKVHVLVHSLHYGNAVFEGARIYNGKVFKLTEHSARLHKSAKMLAYELPYSVAELDAATKLVVKENKLESGYVRPLAWRGAEVIGVSAQGTKVHVMIAAFPWGAYYEQKAIKLITSRWKRPSPESSARRQQGRGAVHHLHAGEGRGARRRLPGRADARLQGPALGSDRREPVPRAQRRTAHADDRDDPERHHAADRDGTGAQARPQGRRARDLPGRTREGVARCS